MSRSARTGSLAALAIRRPVTTAMAFLALGLLGVLSYRSLPVQLLPSFALPQVYVQVFRPGASPEAIENDVLRVLEGEIAGLGGIKEISSTATPGRGTVTVSFDRGTDLGFAALRVQQRVAAVRSRLPGQVFLDVQRFDTSTFSNFVMVVSFRGDADLATMRKLADDTVVPAITAVDGVVQATVQGGATKQIALFLDPERARGSGVSVSQVQAVMGSVTQPVESVGEVDDGGRHLPVVVDGRARLLSDVAEAPLGATGKVRLGHVADIQAGIASSTERYRVNGKTSIGLYVYKDQQSNLIRVAHRLRDRIKRFNEEHAAEGLTLSVDFDAAEIIEKDLDTLTRRALAGAVLSLLVLLVFLRDLRPVLVVALAMPASLLIACDLFKLSGLTLNIASLLGLALSVGMLLDNAIVVLEAIAARRERGDPPQEAARRGSAQVQRAVLSGTATTVVVFVPLYLVETEATPLFKELALSVSFPLLASLLVAITLVPVAASRLVRSLAARGAVRLPGAHGVPRPDAVRSAYSAALRSCLRSPGITMGCFLALILASVVFGAPLLALFVERQRPQEDRIELVATLPEGSAIEATDEVARQIEATVQDLPEIHEVRTGVRDREANVTVVFNEAEKRRSPVDIQRARSRLRQQVESMPGAKVEVDPPPPELPGGGGDVLGTGGTRETVRVSGPGGDALIALARDVKDRIEQVPGVDEVRWDVDDPRPTLEIRPDRQRLAEYGLSTAELVGVVWATRREGEPARYPFRLGDEDVDLVLWVKGGDQRTIEQVRQFPLTTSSGARIPMDAVARVTTGSEPPQLRRWQRERTITIAYGFNDQARASGEASEAARRQVDLAVTGLQLPPGYYASVKHATTELGPAKQMLYIGLALIFIVLAVTFESVVHPFLVMTCVPLAAVGVIWALVLTGTSVNQYVLLALVVLLGIVVNHGILFVDRSQALMAAGARRSTAVLRASHDRLRPIVMTTSTTVIGMLPLAVSTAGRDEIWPPFARAVIGGLVASTAISLVFIPAAALVFGRLADLLKTLGTAGSLAATAAWGGLLWWLYFVTRVVAGEPMRWLLAVPLWLGVLGAARVIQRLARGEHAPELVGDGPVRVLARNARKIYGGLPRPARDFARVVRWRDLAKRYGLGPADLEPPAEARRQLTWQLGLLALLGYLHWIAQSTWGLLLLAVPVLLLLDPVIRSFFALAHRPDAWPPRGWAARLWSVSKAAGAWTYGWLRHRPGSAADITVLVLAGIVLGIWVLMHLVRKGGLVGVITRALAPAPVVALNGVNLEFENGLYGLLGPNGAGKSTLMRLIVNVYRPTRGTITVNDHEVSSHADSLQAKIGFLPQFFGVPPRLSARQYLHHQALLAGKSDRAERSALVEAVLAEVGLQERAEEPLGGYSGGMRQRVGIARTLLNVPRIVVVDEPTVGLDPKERIRFRNLLADLARTRIVLLSTHVVEDIGSACREVIVLDRGEVLFRGAPHELAARAAGQAWLADVAEAELQAFSRAYRVVSSTRMTETLVRVRGVGPRPAGALDTPPTLEDAYLLLLGRPAREVASAA